MTPRLYFEDPLRFEFEAKVIAREGSAVILDRTAFYAEAGGQMADRGALGDARVIDVQADDAGVVRHAIEGALPPIGASVRGVVDSARRREHMALHTGQHMLSHALWDLFDAVTVSSRLGESACTIDVDRAGLTLEDARRAEELVQRIVDEDRPIRAFFPSAGELDALPLRKKPKVDDGVRVVVVEGFDATPCGGTHCTHTAQVELVWVESVERYKGGTRVAFAAGPRARRTIVAESQALRGLAGEMSCAPLEAAANARKLRAQLDAVRSEAGQAWARLANKLADDALARGDGPIAIVLDEADAPLAEPLALRFGREGDRLCAIAVRAQEQLRVTLVRGPQSTADCGALMKRLAKEHGGRGGGRPEHAGGQLPLGVDLDALIRQAS